MPGLAQRGDAPAVGRDDAGVPGGAAQGGVVGVGVGAPHRALAHRLGKAPAGEGHGQIGVDRQALRARPAAPLLSVAGSSGGLAGAGTGAGSGAADASLRAARRHRSERPLARASSAVCRRRAATASRQVRRRPAAVRQGRARCAWKRSLERPLRRWRGRRGRGGRRCRVRGAEADDDFGQAAPMGLARRAPGVDPLSPTK